MENSFQTDFSNVNIHKNSKTASNLGALAFTQGNNVHFAPGQFKPNTKSGKQLIGHEFAHVVQQRQGKVQANKQIGKFQINDNSGLEKEADIMEAKAAAGMIVQTKLKQTNTNSTNQTTQLKVDDYKAYIKDTTLGKFHKKPSEVKGIDKIVEEYVRVRQLKQLGVNAEPLLQLITSITQYVNTYVGITKNNNDRIVKFRTFLPKLTDEKQLVTADQERITHEAATKNKSVQELYDSPSVSKMANFEAQVSEQIETDSQGGKKENLYTLEEEDLQGNKLAKILLPKTNPQIGVEE